MAEKSKRHLGPSYNINHKSNDVINVLGVSIMAAGNLKLLYSYKIIIIIIVSVVVNRQQGWRTLHTNQIIGDDLIIWGGYSDGLPEVHNSEEKTPFITKLDKLNIPLLQWDTVTTTGTPPAGAMEYRSTSIRNDMYVFGGRCDSGHCYHNELHHLNATNKVWRTIPTTAAGPMKKCSSGLISYSYQGSDYLLTLGGVGGRQPTQQQHHSLYIPYGGCYYTNEVHAMNITTSPGNNRL